MQLAVTIGASYGMDQYPQSVPYVKAATPLICQMAGAGVASPAEIVSDLQSASASWPKSPQGVAVINGALAIYEAVYAQYNGSDIKKDMQPYMAGLCAGLQGAIPPSARSARNQPHLVP